MEENWKTLAIDNRYSISTNGNIISNVYKEPRMLHPVIDNRGYYYVRIRNKAYNVHRLVALTFIPTNDTTLHVDHIDGNKLNNHISNLRWCTQKENNNNPITRARISASNIGSKRTPEQRKRMSEAQQKAKPMLGKKHSKETLEKFKKRKPPKVCSVSMLDAQGNVVKIFNSIVEASIETGISGSNITTCCKGMLKTCGGYKWEYNKKEITI